jgi:simple sugar transport system substrate-binding protein
MASTIEAKLKQDPSINYVITLGAPFALTAIESAKAAGSQAKIATFDTNRDLMPRIKSGEVQWAIDQQPYLQGYLAVDSLWLYKYNRNVIGGGRTVATGPYFITKDNVDPIAEFANKGTR